MAMVVKNNMSAINTLNTLNKNSAALAKSLAKVSSGQKINSAADDASGYAISERMRVMVRSLAQADQNANNGASMMKVAEGAVSSTVDILKTMKEKAISAANDSNTDSDRAAIQKELNQSIDQVDDNALITYNGKTLVDGSKMAKGVATKTSLTNQSLKEDTTGNTKLVDLADRNGNGLNIQTTDTLTISYV
ncbi:MAG: flagellin, partial [Selenomonas sp.]|nr:flagellin [Selenomonas sp.]